ncbi:adenylate/guanylate cyclase domain-containing protein [Pontiellaceae bacterium B1224]|nr:adenylate/guanylate cyclase domain-containing protein [Pontiellaceae bacterium B1224]
MAQENKARCIASVLIGSAVVLSLFAFSTTSLYKRFSYAAADFRWTHCAGKIAVDDDVVIVAIDDYSISNLSEKFNYPWPWPRQFYGIVLDYFAQAEAKSVSFDLLFSLPEVARLDINSEESEKAFVKGVKDFGHTVLGENLSDAVRTGQEAPHPAALVFDHADRMPLLEYRSSERLIPSLSESAAAIGIVNFHTDEDGVCRRMPLIFNVGDSYLPQLSFAAYLLAENDRVVSYDSKRNLLLTENRHFQLDHNGFFPVYWYGEGGGISGTFPYYSFYNLFIDATRFMEGQPPTIPIAELKGKHIIICATASGLLDLKPTPFSTSNSPFPGGEIHATLLNNLLNGRNIVEFSRIQLLAITLVLMVLLAYVFISRSLVPSIALALACVALSVGVGFMAFSRYQIDIDYTFPIFAVVFTSAFSSMYKMLVEGRKKREIRSIFSRYLNDDVINLLMENPDRVDLEGTELTGTVLFTDLQGFTTFSEDKSPRTLIKVLNRYFETVTSIVLDQKGMLDKYTGDGVMAIFGAPIARAEHARSACEVILAFRELGVNDLIPSEGDKISTRIGISTGPIVVGNLGSTRRMDFTAIGDTVNLAARLEGVNKAYGTTNIMSEYTYEQVKNEYAFRELDCIRVKGKRKPIRVFTLLDRVGTLSDAALAIEKRFEEAIAVYRERRWEEAAGLFNAVLELNPEDAPAKAYIDRCLLLQNSPDLVDDQGVFTFNTK